MFLVVAVSRNIPYESYRVLPVSSRAPILSPTHTHPSRTDPHVSYSPLTQAPSPVTTQRTPSRRVTLAPSVIVAVAPEPDGFNVQFYMILRWVRVIRAPGRDVRVLRRGGLEYQCVRGFEYLVRGLRYLGYITWLRGVKAPG